MKSEKIIVLDGTPSGVDDLSRAREALMAELRKSAREVSIVELREEKFAHCTGCFQCWLKTPGMCRFADRGREIVAAMVQSDVVPLFTPVTFGGYSSTLKKLVDRWVQCALPFFTKRQGETHHPKRYPRFPRLLALGVQREPSAGEAAIFKTLVGRNALNFDPPSFASEVVAAGGSAAAMS
jgi:multimeric flavodoxin WrbA